MATIILNIPVAAPAAAIELVSLTDATTGSTIALPSVVAFAGPVTVGVFNQWSIVFTASSSMSVNWSGTVTNVGGGTSPIGGTVNGDSVVAAGRYATLNDLYVRFGTTNVNIWSNLDGGKTLVPARVQAAFDFADSEIDEMFVDVLASPIPSNLVLKDAEIVLAGAGWLYGDRGQSDDDMSRQSVELVKAVYVNLLNYRTGIKTFPEATYLASFSPSPFVPMPQNYCPTHCF